MRDACTSPGSRSAPLVLALAREQRLRCYSHVDERCAGFFALGLAKASGLPVAVTCTSGTAAAELLPAAIEAREARVPLLVLTADRPPELRENGAGQAIDQLKLYGGAAKWFFEVGSPTAPAERSCAGSARSPAAPTGPRSRAGPAPCTSTSRCASRSSATSAPPPDDSGRADGRAVRAPRPPGAARHASAAGRAARADRAPRARRARRRAPRARRRRSARPPPRSRGRRAGRCWPTRCRARAAASTPIAHYDALLRDAGASPRRSTPDLVLRVGDLPVSKPLRDLARGPRRRAARSRSTPRAPGRTRPALLATASRSSRAAALARAGRASTRRARRGGLAGAAGAAPTSARPRRSAACSATTGSPSRAVAAELGALLPERGDAVRRLLDARTRHRDVLAGARRPAARALQPRRERHRRDRLHAPSAPPRRARARSCC